MSGFFNGSKITKCARHKSNIIVNCLRNSNHGKVVSPSFGFLKQRISSALCAITANRKKYIDSHFNKMINCSGNIHGAARGAQNGAAFFMNVIHKLRG